MVQPSTHTTVHFDVQNGHLNDEAKVEEVNPNSSLLALSILSAKLLKDTDQIDILASVQDITPEEPLPTINLDPPSI